MIFTNYGKSVRIPGIRSTIVIGPLEFRLYFWLQTTTNLRVVDDDFEFEDEVDEYLEDIVSDL